MQALASIEASAVRTLFEEVDRSADGLVSHAELDGYIAADLQPGAATFETGHARNRRARALRDLDDDKSFTSVDTDASGGVDLAELRTYYASQGFTNDQITTFVRFLDTNGDGTVTRSEWRQALVDSRRELRERRVRSSKGLEPRDTGDGDGDGDDGRGFDPALASSMQLEALTAPVRPPKASVFNDLLEERSKHLGDRAQDAAYEAPKRIAKTQHRAIRLFQLEALLGHIEKRCLRERWVSAYSGQPLTPDGVNLYAHLPTHHPVLSPFLSLRTTPCTRASRVPCLLLRRYDGCTYVIKPATSLYQCSYVEFVSSDGSRQKPHWVVSHWWGERVYSFCRCLKMHARDRGLDTREGAYWVCAYASNQWQIGTAVTSDPRDSAFFQAMSIAKGVVSVVDSSGLSWRRIWCAYEVATALEWATDVADFKYDIYTSYATGTGSSRAVGITDGLAVTDDASAQRKAKREMHFPPEALANALSVQLHKGQATVESDRVQILNAIIGDGRDLDAMPPQEHARFDAMDTLFRRRVEELAFNVALSQVPPTPPAPTRPHTIIP